MGLVIDHEPALPGYEAVPLVLAGEKPGWQGSAAVLRRRSPRQTRRAIIYVHGPGDSLAGDDIAEWWIYRGFHFYAVDLRAAGTAPATRPAGRSSGAGGMGEEDASVAAMPAGRSGGGTGPAPRDGKAAAEDLGRCFECLDEAVAHLRQDGEIRTVVVCAHGTGALIAALWCHLRRASGPADALVLASPQLGPGGAPLRTWAAAGRPGHPAWRQPPLVASAQRRVRRGLNISCPVLVMCPAGDPETPAVSGLLLLSQLVAGWRLTVRLGQHVTWLQLEGRLPGHGMMAAADRKRFFDQLSRWLGAYLSAQLRDQLL